MEKEKPDGKKRIMALDVGSKRTGIAISDESRQIALPLTHIVATQKKDWLRQIQTVIIEKNVDQIVVGLPLNQWGEEGIDAKNIQSYIALLREETQLDVVEWDERFTTVQAERVLIDADMSRKKRKNVIDQVAATILLQSYLDSRPNKTES